LNSSGVKVLILHIVFISVLLTAAAPFIIGRFIKTKFEADNQFTAAYEQLDFNVWNLSYTLKNIQISSRNDGRSLFTSEQAKITFHCHEKTDWKLVCHLEFSRPQLNILGQPDHYSKGQLIQSPIRHLIGKMTMASIDEIHIDDGSILFESPNGEEIFRAFDLQLSMRNLSDIKNQSDALGVVVNGAAKIGDSMLKVDARLTQRIDGQDFDLKAQLLNANFNRLARLLDLPYGVDSDQQTVSLFTEASSDGKRILGFTNPRMEFIQQASTELRPKLSSRAIPFEVNTVPSSTVIQRIEITLRAAFKQGLLIYMKENYLTPGDDMLRQPIRPPGFKSLSPDRTS
jgi:hypothetical protein